MEKEDSHPDGPKVKKRKVLQKYRQKYEYELKHPVIRKSGVAALFAYCTLCLWDFSVGHDGIGDVERHVKTRKHAAKVDSNPQRNIQHFFTNSKDLSVIRAQTLFIEFIIEHNIPLACTDHVALLFRKMFPRFQYCNEIWMRQNKHWMYFWSTGRRCWKTNCRKYEEQSVCTVHWRQQRHWVSETLSNMRPLFWFWHRQGHERNARNAITTGMLGTSPRAFRPRRLQCLIPLFLFPMLASLQQWCWWQTVSCPSGSDKKRSVAQWQSSSRCTSVYISHSALA